MVKNCPEGTLRTTVYHKKTHTNQYLNFCSNHHFHHERSVVRTLLHRAQHVVTDEEDQQKEIKHVKDVLIANNYKPSMFNIPEKQTTPPSQTAQPDPNQQIQRRPKQVSIPYVQGVSEKLQSIFKKYNISTIHKPYNTVKDFLVHPKDPTPTLKQCGVIYNIKCENCDQFYIGESGRQLSIRVKEHQTKANSAIYQHINETGHKINPEKVKIICREDFKPRRKIKESISIRQCNPPLNGNEGNTLPAIYNPLLECRRELHDESCDTMSHDS